MAPKKVYLVDGHPYMIDNIGGKNHVVDIGSGEVIFEEGKDFTSLGQAQKLCDALNFAWSDGYKTARTLHGKKD